MTGHVLALSGGVGGAKLALGLSSILDAGQLTIVCNTGDDFDHLGLYICPDLDTVCYTLAGKSNPDLGWGLAGESWQVMSTLKELGGESWFNLGDRDIATHLLRRQWRDEGRTLSDITAELCRRQGVNHRIVPMTDDPVSTVVLTDTGPLAFQHYFVRERCQPKVTGFNFDGIDTARIQPAVAKLLASPELTAVVLCPSNPFVSIDPIVNLPGMAALLKACPAPVIGVSPIVGGAALKGPSAKMMTELGINISATAVAEHYRDWLDGFVIDTVDHSEQTNIEDMGIRILVTNTVMTTLEDRVQLASDCLRMADQLSGGAN